MLEFRALTPDMKGLIDSYTFRYGGGSCQHSFVSSFCLYDKYGDMFCEHDNFLYTLRAKRCTEDERVYLFPYGERSGAKNAVRNILNDAHEHNTRANFTTLTASAKDTVCGLFPGVFTAEYMRDLAEYVYSVDSLKTYAGPGLSGKRRDFMRFTRDYAGRYRTERITEDDISAVLGFQDEWLDAKLSAEDNPEHRQQILHEDSGARTLLENFGLLGASGIMILIDGHIRGFACGVRLSDDCFDEITESGDRTIPNIYPALRHEIARVCCEGCRYLNLEEDLGVVGLRKAKMHYKPEFMIEKYIVREVQSE